MTVLKLLSNQGFISYNKIIAREYGVAEAIVLGELCSIFAQFKYNEFYFNQNKISNDTALSVKQIRTALYTLATAGIITITKKGIPCKNWYYINEDVLINVLENAKEPEEIDSEEPYVPKVPDCVPAQQDVPNLPNWERKKVTTVCAKKEPLLNSKNTSKNTNSSSETEFKSDTEKNTAGQKEEEPFLNFIKKKFGSAHVFTKDFKKKLEIHMSNNQILPAETENYLNFVYELCQKKKPANMSAYFFTTCLNDVTAANYIHQKINGAPEKKKDFRCPVCGCMHSAFEDCPKCGLDKDGRNNAELIGILQKEQKLLPEQRRKLNEEMDALTMEFMSLPPNRYEEKKLRQRQIYAKYGLLDQKILISR